MVFTRANVLSNVQSMIGEFPSFTGDNEVGEAEIELAIDQALRRYNRDSPQEISVNNVGDGGRYYVLTTILTSWDEGSSQILSIDYDSATRITGDELPQFLNEDKGDWKFYEQADVNHLAFITRTPESSVTFTIVYTAPHVLTETTNTILDKFRDGIVYLAVAQTLRMVQVRVEKALDSPGGAEFVSMGDKSQGFGRLIDRYEMLYKMEIGQDDNVKAAEERRDYDLEYIFREDYMFHTSRWQ